MKEHFPGHWKSCPLAQQADRRPNWSSPQKRHERRGRQKERTSSWCKTRSSWNGPLSNMVIMVRELHGLPKGRRRLECGRRWMKKEMMMQGSMSKASWGRWTPKAHTNSIWREASKLQKWWRKTQEWCEHWWQVLGGATAAGAGDLHNPTLEVHGHQERYWGPQQSVSASGEVVPSSRRKQFCKRKHENLSEHFPLKHFSQCKKADSSYYCPIPDAEM